MNNEQMEITAQARDLTAADAEFAEKTAEAAAKGAAGGYKKIEDAVVGGYRKIEDTVVGSYKKIETGAVEGFGKVVDKCVEKLFARDGESVADAKARLSGKEEK